MSKHLSIVLAAMIFIASITVLTGFQSGNQPPNQSAKTASLKQILQQYQGKEMIYNSRNQIGSGSARMQEVGDDYIKLELIGNFKGVAYIPISSIDFVLQLKDEDPQIYFGKPCP